MKIAAVGDMALADMVEAHYLDRGASVVDPCLCEMLLGSDLSIANIECPLTDEQTPFWGYFRTIKGKKSNARLLSEIGVNVGTLANNHIADYGRQGLSDTISVLEEQNIAWVGAGWTHHQAGQPLIIERAGLRMGILALAQPEISAATRLGWGAGVLEDQYAVKCMSSLSREVDIAIAYLHYGVEFSEFPTPHQVRLSRGLVDAGAKLVIGHHPHTPQGYERYKCGFIAYSLGNFLFDMSEGPHRFSRLGLLVMANFENGRLNQVEVLPVDTTKAVVRLLDLGERNDAEQYLGQLSEVLVANEKLNKAYYFTCRNNLEIYVDAFFRNLFRNGNWCQARDLIIQQIFWPQIFELRKDLIRFVVSGEALKFERSRKKEPTDFKGHFWRWICQVGFYIGLPLRLIPGFRII